MSPKRQRRNVFEYMGIQAVCVGHYYDYLVKRGEEVCHPYARNEQSAVLLHWSERGLARIFSEVWEDLELDRFARKITRRPKVIRKIYEEVIRRSEDNSRRH
jgi:hypothetical protein